MLENFGNDAGGASTSNSTDDNLTTDGEHGEGEVRLRVRKLSKETRLPSKDSPSKELQRLANRSVTFPPSLPLSTMRRGSGSLVSSQNSSPRSKRSSPTANTQHSIHLDTGMDDPAAPVTAAGGDVSSTFADTPPVSTNLSSASLTLAETSPPDSLAIAEGASLDLSSLENKFILNVAVEKCTLSGNTRLQHGHEKINKPTVIRSIPLDIFKSKDSASVSDLFSSPSKPFVASDNQSSITGSLSARSGIASAAQLFVDPSPSVSTHVVVTAFDQLPPPVRSVPVIKSGTSSERQNVAALPGNLFGGPAEIISSGDTFSNPPPVGAGANNAQSKKATVAAVDVFNREPPTNVVSSVKVPGLPPVPPGVITAKPPPSIQQKTSSAVQPADIAFKAIQLANASLMSTPLGPVPMPASISIKPSLAATPTPVFEPVPSLTTAPYVKPQSLSPSSPQMLSGVPVANINSIPPNASPSIRTATVPLFTSNNSMQIATALVGNIGDTIRSSRARNPIATVVRFGFGGKVLVSRPRKYCTNGTSLNNTMIFRVLDAIQANIALPPTFHSFISAITSFPGPLRKDQQQQHLLAVKAFLTDQLRQCAPGSKHLLLRLLDISVDSRGVFHSDSGTVETKIVDVLLANFDGTKAAYEPFNYTTGNRGGPSDPDGLYNMIEELLVSGRREEAVNVAVQQKDWALAMLIAGNCRVEVYQDIVKKFADESFDMASPLHFLSLLYSNQASSAVKFGGKRLSRGANDTKDALLFDWKKNIAALLSNKTPKWKELVEGVGNRLLIDNRDVYAAHFTFLCAGELPSPPGAGLFTLVGFADSPHNLMRAIGNCDESCILAFRMTEVLEFIYSISVNKRDAGKPAQAQSMSSFSFTGLFGTASNKADSQVHQEHCGDGGDPITPTRYASVVHALCPLKLRFAMLLCDLGLPREALDYAFAIKRSIDELSNVQNKGGKGDESKPPKNFSKKFLRDLDDLLDRLSPRIDGKAVAPAQQILQQQSVEVPGNSSFFGLGNVLNAIQSSSALKNLVDGRDESQNAFPSTKQSTVNPPTQPAPSSSSETVGRQTTHSGPLPHGLAPVMSMSGLPVPPYVQPVQTQVQYLSDNVHTFNSYPTPTLASHSQSSSLYELNNAQPMVSVTSPSYSTFSSDFKQDSQQPLPNSKRVDSSTSNKAVSQSAEKPGEVPDPSKGLVSQVKKGLLKWLYPDAHDASDNLGDVNKAYFDEKLKRWVFPGQEVDANEPSMAPPPVANIGALSSMASQLPIANSMSPPTEEYDSLAALMAPRTVSYSALQAPSMNAPPSGNDNDPLAALMAPRSYSLSAFQSQQHMSSNSLSAKAPSISMWTPPPAPSAVTPPSENFDTSLVDSISLSSMPSTFNALASSRDASPVNFLEYPDTGTQSLDQNSAQPGIYTSANYSSSTTAGQHNFIEDF